MNMSMNREIAQLEIIYGRRRRNRWYGDGISTCFSGLESGAKSPKQSVNWDRVRGLATVLVVTALGWTALGIAVARFAR
jgi:hypothetical protein